MVVVVVTRMSLDLHEETVDLLRLMGAGDDYVGRQFEQHALSNALRGGLLGFTAAIVTVGAFDGRDRGRSHGSAAAAGAGDPGLAAARLRAGGGSAADRGRRAAHRALGPRPPALGGLPKSGGTGFLSGSARSPGAPPPCPHHPSWPCARSLFHLFFFVWTTVYCLAVLPAYPFFSPRVMRQVAQRLAAGACWWGCA